MATFLKIILLEICVIITIIHCVRKKWTTAFIIQKGKCGTKRMKLNYSLAKDIYQKQLNKNLILNNSNNHLIC